MSRKETVQKCTVSFDLCYIVTKINLKIKRIAMMVIMISRFWYLPVKSVMRT